MTFEELSGQDNAAATGDRMQSAGTALEELLVSAKKQDCLTVGVYESAQVMNVDPDSVAFCVLATDEEYEWDIALQIHFTLIQAFCFDNDINIVRVNDIERLADIVGSDQDEEPKDVHCMLVTVSCSTLFCILTYTLSTPTFALHLHVILISLLLFFFFQRAPVLTRGKILLLRDWACSVKKAAMSTNGCLLLLCRSADRRWLWHVNETRNKSKISILKGTPVQSKKALRYCLDYPHNWEDKSGLTQRTGWPSWKS
uniref:Growth arrest and DNA-damage-inducible, gamma a n=1 Tax=Cyprinus carpio TaxID=7962 RepID=A0A8C2DIQ5_CYPCA